MLRSLRLFLLFACAVAPISCQRAQHYPAAAVSSRPASEESAEVPFRLSWLEPRTPPRDVPIVFIPCTDETWASLPAYWNVFPAQPAALGMRTAHLGFAPLGMLSALVLTDQADVVKIKVPLGLPDPTPHVPSTNPLFVKQWELGKRLFFERLLPAGADFYSCAKCHDPAQGFTEASRHPVDGTLNTLSLVNVVYNRRQFWDGRVQTLEETLFRNLHDERPVSAVQSRERALEHHVWGGFVRELVAHERYQPRFQEAFGVEQPTQDTVARALATYLRTLLAGNSLYDRAEKLRADSKAATLSATHFQAAFDDQTEKTLQDVYRKEWKRDQMPALLAKGYAIFHGQGRCAQCHAGPLFTDHDYHNVGYPDEVGVPTLVGKETGRSAQVPIGQKASRYIGAYRTPSLRNLTRTRPYFHNGSLPTLRSVVEFYDQGIIPTEHLALALKKNNPDLRLNLAEDDPDAMDALVMFLRALSGAPVDAAVSAPPQW